MPSTKWLPRSSDFHGPEFALHACISNDHSDHGRLRDLLTTCSPDAVNRLHDKWGAPLHVAIRIDSLVAVKMLLAAGADPVTPRDYRGAGFDPPSPLTLAIGLGRAAIVRRLWQQASPDAHANGGERPYWSCVAHAARCGQVEILKWLLEEWQRWSPAALASALQAAARRLDFFCVEMLLSRGEFAPAALDEALRAAAVDTEYEGRESVSRELCTTAEGLAQARIVQVLLRNGADPNCRCGGSADDEEALVTAAAQYTERESALRALLEGGADPNAPRKDGSTVLHMLAAPVFTKRLSQSPTKHHEASVRLLLKHGASMYTKAGTRGELPLHRAAHGSTLHVFRLYLAALTPEDQTAAGLLQLVDNHGESLIHWAAAGGKCAILEYLLSLDRSATHINNTTDHGWMPLLCALVPQEPASKGLREAVLTARLLLAHGADPASTATTAQGWTPLHCLALHRDKDARSEAYALARDLIARGAAVEARAALPGTRRHAWGRHDDARGWWLRTGMTPLMWAADRGADGVRAVLEEAGTDATCTDDDGRDAERVARESCYVRDEDDDWLCFGGFDGWHGRVSR